MKIILFCVGRLGKGGLLSLLLRIDSMYVPNKILCGKINIHCLVKLLIYVVVD